MGQQDKETGSTCSILQRAKSLVPRARSDSRLDNSSLNSSVPNLWNLFSVRVFNAWATFASPSALKDSSYRIGAVRCLLGCCS